jgi:hypothetical protein
MIVNAIVLFLTRLGVLFLAGLPLIMETPVQVKGPAVNYKKSLQAGEVVFRQEESEVGMGTDKRDILKLYSLCK